MNLPDIKTQIRKILTQNPETKNLKIADDDLLTYYYYYKNKSKESQDGYRQELKTDPFMRVVWVPTEKSTKIQFQEDFQKTNALFDSELDLQNYSFDKLIIDNKNKQKVFKEMQKITKKNGKIDKGFYLYGSFKTGKTFFLKTLAQQLLKQQISVMFLFMPNLIRKFKSFMYNNSLETRFEQLKTVNCLFLDDFGAENMSPWFRDEILLPLLYYRAEKKLPFFISSNYNFLQLDKHLMGSINDNNYIRVHKIIDKINELTQFYDFSKKETS
ncbi:DnaA ATPase domain-containing protein [Candidatus Phytoplasma solani]|uniref:DNA replication protein n=2 Tax=Candidatus Phytoplasma solani TaxID=69896 RepID=A0A421NV35_9MOLU|nr:ATP-binding protein [Candidatus Phytoplasma solani]RMI87878.1 DNA replication protein [Candidatus Phytoplasma solani]CCP88529.1 Primosomal protein DnaC [Candidatus Phytoplasma solani]